MDLEDASKVLEERKQQSEEARLRDEALNSGSVGLTRPRPPSRAGSRAGASHSSLPPPAHQASGVSTVSAAAAAASSLSASGLGSGTPNSKLLELVWEQQRLLDQAGARRAQVLLGAQMSQLHLDSTRNLDRVDVLQANQMAMQANQLGMLRKQQLAAAELKVVFDFCKS